MVDVAPFEFREIAPYAQLVRCGSVLIGYFRMAPSAAIVELGVKNILAAARASGGRVGYLHVLEPRGGRTPDDEARRELLKAFSAIDQVVHALAIVVLVDGFFGAAVRAAGSGMLLASRPRVPTKMFGNVSEGVRWVLAELDRRAVNRPSAVDVEAAFAALRARLIG